LTDASEKHSLDEILNGTEFSDMVAKHFKADGTDEVACMKFEVIYFSKLQII